MKKLLKIVPYLAIALLVGVTVSYAGSLTPPGSVANTMYTLTDIFNLSTGTTTTLGTGAIDATPGSISSTGKTLTEVYEAIEGEVDNLSAGVIATGTSAFGIDGALSAGGLPKTGQTLCYDVDGNTIACTNGDTALGGQDGYYLKGLPTSGARFVDNTNNTITDNATGLMWKKCSEGLSGTTCDTGGATAMSWETALSTCEADTTATFTNWRLPNSFELYSISDLGTFPFINATFFPNTYAGYSYYWSSSSYLNDNEGGSDPSNSGSAWGLGFGYGYGANGNSAIKSIGKNLSNYVRCVR